MKADFTAQHWNDPNGNPAGGCSSGTGVCISWQNGPLGRGENRQEPNGAFVETIIAIAIDRLMYYQRSDFSCKENANAIGALRVAWSHLRDRTAERENRGVEGTHEK